MGEEPKGGKPAKKSGGLGQIIVMLVLVIVSAVWGMAIYKFVLAPKLDGQEQKHAEDDEGDSIPAGAVAFDFPEATTAVTSSDPNASNSVLIYAVSLVCENEETKALIEKNKQWFTSMLSDLHRNRTKEELSDPAVEKSILEQAKEQANSLLRRLEADPKKKEELKIIQALHLKFAVFTL